MRGNRCRAIVGSWKLPRALFVDLVGQICLSSIVACKNDPNKSILHSFQARKFKYLIQPDWVTIHKFRLNFLDTFSNKTLSASTPYPISLIDFTHFKRIFLFNSNPMGNVLQFCVYSNLYKVMEKKRSKRCRYLPLEKETRINYFRFLVCGTLYRKLFVIEMKIIKKYENRRQSNCYRGTFP